MRRYCVGMFYLHLIFIVFHPAYATNTTLELNISQSDLKVIHNIIAAKLPADTTNQEDPLQFFYGNDSKFENDTDLSFLDPATQARLFNNAKTKTILAELEFNKTVARLRRWENHRGEAYYMNDFFTSKAMDLMQQSIYATRFRLQDTKPIRKMYQEDAPYNLAIFYGALMEIRVKLDNVYTTLMRLEPGFKFLYYLYLYERIVALSTDVDMMVQRMFSIAEAYKSIGDYEEPAYGDEIPPELKNRMIG